MKILWLCNLVLPFFSEALGVGENVFGGWLTGLLGELVQSDKIELTVCMPLEEKPEEEGIVGKFRYATFSEKDHTKERFQEILDKISPDVIHIFGTEFRHSLTMVRAAEERGMSDRVVVSIQGLVSVIAKHYEAFLPHRVTRAATLRDLLRRGRICDEKKKFEKRGSTEIEALQSVKYVIGRTDWDRAALETVAPRARYFHCNESLRDSFYECSWDRQTCEKHSIFLSQSSYPIKGFHLMLEAMPAILEEFCDAKVYVAGHSPFSSSWIQRLRQNYYRRYLGILIRRYHLEDRIEFLGILSEKEMCRRYLAANVFVLPSSIENSPNSLGEAMLVGVPSVASDVGGVKNMLQHGKEGFVYQADAPYMLAHYVKRIFRDPQLADSFSSEARRHAAETHHRKANADALLTVYQTIIEE